MRRSTRSRMALPSSEASLWAVNEAHSGFCPSSVGARYEIRYFGMAWISLPFGARPAAVMRSVNRCEQVVRIVRARRGLRVVLHAEDGQLAVTQALRTCRR